MFEDIVGDEEVTPLPPRPLLLNLPHIEELIIETKPLHLEAIRTAFLDQVFPEHAAQSLAVTRV